MRSIWIQIILLLVYVLLVFFVSRIIDLVLWYHHGMPSTQIVDPLLLSVRQLKQLLENRGVSYTGYVEKKELAQLAEAAAHIVQGEVEELGQGHSGSGDVSSRERLPVPPTPSHFTGGPHFYEEVEDTKDSVWLVQVVPAGSKQMEPLLDDYSWRVVCNHVAPFAIRTGIFDCRLDRRLCSSKGWHHPLLLLALPKGTRAKDKVILKTFTATRPQTILEWVRDQLSIRVNTINSFEELKQNWLGNNTDGIATSNTHREVRVLLFTHLLHPPLFLAALSIKFTGRIKFGMFSVKKTDSETLRKLKQMDFKVPSYIILTPEHRIVYGKRKFEHFNFNSMNRFLRVVQPEMNDVFLFSLVLVNLLVALQIFQVSVHLWWKHLVRCLWTLISYNFWLFVLWLIILATYCFSIVNISADKCLILVRFISLTEIGSLVRTDWQVFLANPYLVFTTFLLYGALSAWVMKLCGRDEPTVRSELERPWWEVLPGDSFWINCLFRPMATLSRPIPPSELELEEGIEMLIERLAVPNLWLQPVIPNEYIKDLPVWKFRGWDTGSSELTARYKHKDIKCDSPEAVQWLMDSEDMPKEHCRASGKLCRYSQEDGEGSQSGNDPCHHKYARTISDGPSSMECVCKSCVKYSDRQRKAKGSAIPDAMYTYESSVSPLHAVDKTADVSGNCVSEGNRDCSSACVSEDSSDEGSGIAAAPPTGMLPTSECAVCLETYSWSALLCGLPCGHSYHHTCILLWLQRDNHHCPVCRWPAYRAKLRAAQHLHRE